MFFLFYTLYFLIIFLKLTFFIGGGSFTIVDVTIRGCNFLSIIIFLNGLRYFSDTLFCESYFYKNVDGIADIYTSTDSSIDFWVGASGHFPSLSPFEGIFLLAYNL